MRVRLVAAMAVIASSLPCFAADSEPADTSFENQARWGSPWLLTEPEYPKAARDAKITGFVDVEARIAATGELKETELKPGSSDAELLVDAVRDAARLWRLYPPLGRDCLPTRERVTTRVWFEIDNGTPRIFVSRGKPRPMSNLGLKPLVHPHPRYPRGMITSGRDAYVFGRGEIDPAGKVGNVTATAFPRELASNLLDFEEETRRALEGWEFPPASEGVTRTRYFCVDVRFRLLD